MVFRPTGLFHVKHTWARTIENQNRNVLVRLQRVIAASDPTFL